MKLTLAQIDAEAGESEPLVIDLSDLDDDATFTLPHPEDLGADVLLDDTFDPAQPREALKILLGAEEFDRLLHTRGLTLRRLRIIFTHYMTHYGIPMPGEDGASPH